MGNKLGICLTGGGARGCYQIGALVALDELGILQDVQAYSGTSIGAANAASVASKGIEAAKNFWFHMPENNLPKNQKATGKNRWDTDRGYYSMEVFETVMKEAVDYDALRNTEVYVTVSEGGNEGDSLFELFKNTLSFRFKNTRYAHYLPLHKLPDEMIHKGIVASCSIPFFFAPVAIEGKKYYDGGVFDNVPVRPLVEAGCDEIYVIYLHKYRAKVDRDLYPGVTFHEIRHERALELGRILKFSENKTEKLYQYGYDDVMQYINQT